jgi:predicted amidophosphoribosyltransferase
MAGYGMQEKMARDFLRSGNPHVCGSCGGRVRKHETLCQACKDDIFFAGVCVQVENEKPESGESQ